MGVSSFVLLTALRLCKGGVFMHLFCGQSVGSPSGPCWRGLAIGTFRADSPQKWRGARLPRAFLSRAPPPPQKKEKVNSLQPHSGRRGRITSDRTWRKPQMSNETDVAMKAWRGRRGWS